MEDIGALRRRRPDRGDGDRRRRAGGRRPGRLARHVVGPGRSRWPSAGLTVSLGDEIYKAVLPMVFAEGWEKLDAELDDPRRRSGPSAPGGPTPCPGCSTALADGADDDDPRRLPGRQPASSRPTARWPRVDFQLIGTGRGAYDLAYFVTQSLDRRRRLRARAGAVRPLDRPRWRPAACPRPTSRPPGTTTARPPCSASSTPWSPGGAWTSSDPRQVRPGHHDARALRPGGGRARPRDLLCWLDAWRIRRAAGVRWRPATPERTTTSKGSSSTGRAAVSKTAGWGFESLLPCSSSLRNRPRPWR